MRQGGAGGPRCCESAVSVHLHGFGHGSSRFSAFFTVESSKGHVCVEIFFFAVAKLSERVNPARSWFKPGGPGITVAATARHPRTDVAEIRCRSGSDPGPGCASKKRTHTRHKVIFDGQP